MSVMNSAAGASLDGNEQYSRAAWRHLWMVMNSAAGASLDGNEQCGRAAWRHLWMVMNSAAGLHGGISGW